MCCMLIFIFYKFGQISTVLTQNKAQCLISRDLGSIGYMKSSLHVAFRFTKLFFIYSTTEKRKQLPAVLSTTVWQQLTMCKTSRNWKRPIIINSNRGSRKYTNTSAHPSGAFAQASSNLDKKLKRSQHAYGDETFPVIL